MKVSNTELPKSGLAIASLILGILSFIPLVGVLLGLIAIILGIVSLMQIKNKLYSGKFLGIFGILLGFLGLTFTFVLYGLLFYFGFVAKDGPFKEIKIASTRQILAQNAGGLEYYHKQFGKYPDSLKDKPNIGYTFFTVDQYLSPLYYKVSPDGKSYELRSLGPDKTYGTADDISSN